MTIDHAKVAALEARAREVRDEAQRREVDGRRRLRAVAGDDGLRYVGLERDACGEPVEVFGAGDLLDLADAWSHMRAYLDWLADDAEHLDDFYGYELACGECRGCIARGLWADDDQPEGGPCTSPRVIGPAEAAAREMLHQSRQLALAMTWGAQLCTKLADECSVTSQGEPIDDSDAHLDDALVKIEALEAALSAAQERIAELEAHAADLPAKTRADITQLRTDLACARADYEVAETACHAASREATRWRHLLLRVIDPRRAGGGDAAIAEARVALAGHGYEIEAPSASEQRRAEEDSAYVGRLETQLEAIGALTEDYAGRIRILGEPLVEVVRSLVLSERRSREAAIAHAMEISGLVGAAATDRQVGAAKALHELEALVRGLRLDDAPRQGDRPRARGAAGARCRDRRLAEARRAARGGRGERWNRLRRFKWRLR